MITFQQGYKIMPVLHKVRNSVSESIISSSQYYNGKKIYLGKKIYVINSLET